jgi:hypothetical protein
VIHLVDQSQKFRLNSCSSCLSFIFTITKIQKYKYKKCDENKNSVKGIPQIMAAVCVSWVVRLQNPQRPLEQDVCQPELW